MSARPYSAIFLALLMLSGSFMVFPIRAPPADGDWVVTGTEVVENQTVTLDGNLTVKSGGSLTLANVTLILNPHGNGQSGILAEEGSSLSIYNSNITSGTSFRFFFLVLNATFVMKDGELGGAGTDLWEWDNDGLKIHADNAVIEGVYIHDGWGVMLDSAHNSKVINCTLERIKVLLSRQGTTPEDLSSNNLILGNTLRNCTGIILGGHDDVVANNTIIDSMVSIRLEGGYNNFITGNHIVIHTPIAWGAIVLQHQCYNNTVLGNSIICSRTSDLMPNCIGINLLQSSYNNIENNIMTGVQLAVLVSYSYNNVVAYNEITNVTFDTVGTDKFYIQSCDGIQLYHASGNFIAGNQLSSVDNNAILLWENSKNNTIQANIIDKAYDGIMLHYASDNNTIVNNALSGIVSWSVVVDESSGNKLFGNNFEDSDIRALDNGSNSWNSTLEGNYWGDYLGIDNDGNGVGDVPYSIPLNGSDKLPLIEAVAIEPFSTPKTQAMDAYLCNAPPAFEELVVSSSETWRDVTLGREGQGVRLHINSGASLTLINVTLKLTGENHIVEAGASLFIYNSTITMSDPLFGGYVIYLVDPKEFVLRNSTVLYGANGPAGDQSAIVCFNPEGGSAPEKTPRITIEDSLFLHNYNALGIFTSGDNRIVNNTISYTHFGIYTCIATVDGNRISNVIIAGLYGGDCCYPDPEINPSRPIFRNNIISNSWGVGVKIECFKMLEFRNNTISDCEEGILISTAWTYPDILTISENEITRTIGWGLRIKVYMSHPATITVVKNNLTDCGKGILLEPMTHDVLLYHNNIINSPNSTDLGNNTWCNGGEGNYWSSLNGTDSDFDGISEVPFILQNVSQERIVDEFPFMQMNGWETKIYLTLNTTFGSIPFLINGTSFTTGADGTAVQRLGYVDDYLIWVAPSHQIEEGTWAIFDRWGDGLANYSRVVHLSSSQTLSAEYKVQYNTIFNFTAGTISVVQYSQYDDGAIVNCTIVSSPGYQLKNITTTGGVSLIAIYGNIATFVVNGPGTATGNYVSILADYTLDYIIIAIVAIAAAIGVGIYFVKKRK